MSAPDDHVEQEAAKPRPRGCGGIFFCLMLIMGSLFGAGLGILVSFLEDAKGTIEKLEEFRPRIGSKVYSWDGEVLGEFTTEGRQLVQLCEIPLHLQKAFLAAEDDKFYEHKGVRFDALASILLYVLQTGRTRGASTITQQVVRNIETLGVGLERTLLRKFREGIVALQVERDFTKDEVLELYLNQIFLGISAYGVEAASRQYFGKSCRYLTLGEAATLAGLTRSPNRNQPIDHPEQALKYRNIVLDAMLDNRFVTGEERGAAMAEDLSASVVSREEQAKLRKAGKGIWAPNKFKAPYFTEEIRTFILSQYGEDEVFGNGLEIHTTLDLRMQRAAEKALLTALEAFDEKKRAYLEKRGRGAEFTPVSGALVCIDNRPGFKGFVRAMVGGRDFDKQKFNCATQAERQPGSSVKPFVWAAAIAQGMSPSTVIIDEPFERIDGAGKPWRPKNFGDSFLGPIPIRVGIEKSVNIVSVKLVEQIGMPTVRSYLQRCGITTPIDDSVALTIGLGTPDVRVIDHCVAYSCFPNGGVRYDPIMVMEVKNRDGIVRYDYKAYMRREEAMDRKVAYVVTHMLQGVCTPDPSLKTEQYPHGYYPTGHRTSALERPRGGKTGTTNNSRNVWFCGFTVDFTCVVWMGYWDNRPLGHGQDYTGGRLACPVWTEFMLAAHEGLAPRDFEIPYGITFYTIDRLTAVLGGNYKEAYIAGTAPPAEWFYDDYQDLDTIDSKLLEPLFDAPVS